MTETKPGYTHMTETALSLARKGFHVFPIREGSKKPAISGWPHRATTDEGTIIGWWNGVYADHNIGIATEPSGLIVVDLDDKDGKLGSEAYAELCDANTHVDTLQVRTPTGGAHLYFSVPEGMTLKTSAGALGTGIDTRAMGGFVVASGSALPVGSYTTIIDIPIAECPTWIADRLQRPKATKSSDLLDISLDSVIDVKAAEDYLRGVDPALQGEGGDAHTYQVCCHLHNLGISIPKGVEILTEEWNGRCEPPWSLEDLAEKMQRAYQYAEKAPGCNSLNLPSVRPKIIHSVSHMSESIPPRDWILDGRLISGYVTLTVAPGGVGKSMFTMLEALSVATGKNLTGSPPIKTGPVLIYNTEDPQDEVERRIMALCKHNGINSRKLDNVYYASGVQSPLRFVVSQGGGAQITHDRQTLEDLIEEHNIVLVVIDPFVRCHGVNENSNSEIDLVVQQLSAMAVTTQCAVSVVHHTRKLANNGDNDTMDISRGASALVSAARIVHVLIPPNEEDRDVLGLSEEDAWSVVRLSRVKGNMSSGSTPTKWYTKRDVELENGDHVGVLEHRNTSIQDLLVPTTLDVGIETSVAISIVDALGPFLGTGTVDLDTFVAVLSSQLPYLTTGMSLSVRKDYVRSTFEYRINGKEFYIEMMVGVVNIGEV